MIGEDGVPGKSAGPERGVEKVSHWEGEEEMSVDVAADEALSRQCRVSWRETGRGVDVDRSATKESRRLAVSRDRERWDVCDGGCEDRRGE